VTFLLQHLNYVAVIILMMLGLFVTFSSGNLIKRMIGLAIFQTSTGLFFISLGKVQGGTAAITISPASPEAKALAAQIDPVTLAQAGVNGVVYSNPLPHVLILTAIVVGVATLAVGLAIAVRIREAYGSVEAADIAARDRVSLPGQPAEPLV
jgi:multicomponent Na+:H+ antiporter subunit C